MTGINQLGVRHSIGRKRKCFLLVYHDGDHEIAHGLTLFKKFTTPILVILQFGLCGISQNDVLEY